LILLASLWGAAFLFVRIAVPEFGALPLSGIRSLVAAFTLVPIMLFKGQGRDFLKYWPHFIVMGLISTALPFTLINYTTQYTSAGFSSILNAMTPMLSTLVAWSWLKESLTLAAVIGIILGFLGVIVMVFDDSSISSNVTFLPILAGVGAAFFYGMTGNYSRKFLTHLPAITLATACQIFSALSLLPFCIYLWPAGEITTTSWICAVILGIFCTSLPFILYFYLLEHVGVAKTVIVTYLIPVFATLSGVLFLSESISLKMATGAGFILTGIALTTGVFSRRKLRHEH